MRALDGSPKAANIHEAPANRGVAPTPAVRLALVDEHPCTVGVGTDFDSLSVRHQPGRGHSKFRHYDIPVFAVHRLLDEDAGLDGFQVHSELGAVELCLELLAHRSSQGPMVGVALKNSAEEASQTSQLEDGIWIVWVVDLEVPAIQERSAKFPDWQSII